MDGLTVKNTDNEQQGYLDMKAKISTAYYEVTLVIITYDNNTQTRVTFEGDFHYFRATNYVKYINEGSIGGGYNP